MRRFLGLAIGVAIFLALAPAADAQASIEDLTDPRTCTVGGIPGTSRVEWRVQLGAFSDLGTAELFARNLGKKRIGAEVYSRAAATDAEDFVVVTSAFRSRSEAERVARSYRRVAAGAFVRRYRIWR